MKYTEDTLTNWTKPSSNTEDQKINNALNMIKDAINLNDELSNKDIEIFSQGFMPIILMYDLKVTSMFALC